MANSYFWRCQCGEAFPDRSWELGYFDSSSASGYHRAVAHQNLHKTNKDPERIEGLYMVDDNGQEYLVFEGFNWGMAIREGVLPPAKSKLETKDTPSSSKSNGAAAVVTEVYPIRVALPANIMHFYEEDQIGFPEAYPDRRPETIGRWLTECVWLAHMINPRQTLFGFISYLVQLALEFENQLGRVGQNNGGQSEAAECGE